MTTLKKYNINLAYILLFFYSSLNGIAAERHKPAPWIGKTLQGSPCATSSRRKIVGDYDYTKYSDRIEMKIVEDYHFTPEVERLIKGKSGYLEGDLDYTLGKIPNHHRALLSLIRYQFKLNNHLFSEYMNRPLQSPVECYFQRAMNYNKKDAITVSLYAYYLKKIGRLKQSENMYKKALSISPDNPKILYSYSLLLIDLKKYDLALENAKKLYKMPSVPSGLRKKLIKLKVWK